MKNTTVLAIDFGTSNSLAGAWRAGARVEALPLDRDADDPTLMRTLLYFPRRDVCHYGSEAIRKYLESEMDGRLFRSFKSHLSNQAYIGTVVDGRPLPLEEMIGIFLLETKRRAEVLLGERIERAVIGKPARYSLDHGKDEFALFRMTKAVEFAGFKEFRFVPEPLAAALDLRRGLSQEKIVLIGDFGGGTSDFTLIRIGPYAYKKEHVLGLEGCPLAGDALDSLFMSERLNAYFGARAEYKFLFGSNRLRMPPAIMEKLNKPAHIVHLKEADTYAFIREVRKCALGEKDKQAIDRLFTLIDDQQIFDFFECIEGVKRTLSSRAEADFDFGYPDIEIADRFSRSEFDTWSTETRESIFAALDECLRQAGLDSGAVDMVCLTGGSAQVPAIRDEFLRRFGAEKLHAQAHFHSVLSGLIESAGMFEHAAD